jgi:hypothetical protein
MTLSDLTYHADRRFPALSMAAPAIFGATAAGLTLKAPQRTGPVSYATENLKMAGFPPQPERFEGMAIDGALTDFALTLERDLPGFQMIHVLADDTKLTAFLPTLTQLLEERRVLIIIDNAESLLTDTGQWRDEQWGNVFGAVTSHTGLGRVIMTSRRAPAGAPDAIAKNAPAG